MYSNTTNQTSSTNIFSYNTPNNCLGNIQSETEIRSGKALYVIDDNASFKTIDERITALSYNMSVRGGYPLFYLLSKYTRSTTSTYVPSTVITINSSGGISPTSPRPMNYMDYLETSYSSLNYSYTRNDIPILIQSSDNVVEYSGTITYTFNVSALPAGTSIMRYASVQFSETFPIPAYSDVSNAPDWLTIIPNAPYTKILTFEDDLFYNTCIIATWGSGGSFSIPRYNGNNTYVSLTTPPYKSETLTIL